MTWHTNAKAATKQKLIVEEKVSFVAIRTVLDNFKGVAKWVVTEMALLHDCVQILIVGLPDLELDFKASSELVLDVLRTSEATEYTATNHNSHLG